MAVTVTAMAIQREVAARPLRTQQQFHMSRETRLYYHEKLALSLTAQSILVSHIDPANFTVWFALVLIEVWLSSVLKQ